jgi:hypothetical protein
VEGLMILEEAEVQEIVMEKIAMVVTPKGVRL